MGETLGFDAVNAMIKGILLGGLLTQAVARKAPLPLARQLVELGASPAIAAAAATDAKEAMVVVGPNGQQPKGKTLTAVRQMNAATGFSALYRAADQGAVDMVELLLSSPLLSPASINAPPTGCTRRARPLHLACEEAGNGAAQNGGRAIGLLLLRAGARVDLGDEMGRTPLALLGGKEEDAAFAAAIAEAKGDTIPPPVRAAAREWVKSGGGGGRLAPHLLPLSARAALAGGLRIGNRSTKRPNERYQVLIYVRAVSGVPLGAFVEKVTRTALQGRWDCLGIADARQPRHPLPRAHQPPTSRFQPRRQAARGNLHVPARAVRVLNWAVGPLPHDDHRALSSGPRPGQAPQGQALHRAREGAGGRRRRV